MNNRFTSSNKITDAGVGKRHSGSIRILLQEETKRRAEIHTLDWDKMIRESAKKAVTFSLPVNVIMFVEVLKARGNFTCHLLEDKRVRGGCTCCPAATEVSFNITLKPTKNYSSAKF